MAAVHNMTEVLEDTACAKKERMNESHMSLRDSFVCEVAVANLIVESREIMTQEAMCEEWLGFIQRYEMKAISNKTW